MKFNKVKIKKPGRRSVITRKILEILGEVALDSASLFGAIMISNKGTSMKGFEWNHDVVRGKINEWLNSAHDETIKKKKASFGVIIKRLKDDGLILKTDRGLRLTLSGRKKIKSFNNDFPAVSYPKEKDDTVKIFMFDIPENKKGLRMWLGRKLIELGFERAQKSVFVGKFKLPEEFILILSNLGILQHVDVFAVTKRGSLKEII